MSGRDSGMKQMAVKREGYVWCECGG